MLREAQAENLYILRFNDRRTTCTGSSLYFFQRGWMYRLHPFPLSAEKTDNIHNAFKFINRIEGEIVIFVLAFEPLIDVEYNYILWYNKN